MSKILIIHHLEMTWEQGYNNHDTSFYELAAKIKTHIKRSNYDKVILTQFENWKAQHEHFQSGLVDYINQWEMYGYGWFKESNIKEYDVDKYKDKYGNFYVKGGHHSELVLLENWMQKLKSNNVSICGAFDGECIEDLEIALTACEVKFKRLEKLIV